MEPRITNPAMRIPQACQAMQALSASTENTGLPERTLDLVHLRASQITRCGVCVDMHSRMAKNEEEQ